MRSSSILATTLLLAMSTLAAPLRAEDPWVVYPGGGPSTPAKGKHIVLLAGDEEYRSEEALPQLGKILSKHHGFKCTVLFPIDPKTGEINPGITNNVPGTEALATADLMIIAFRFRNLPPEQMKPIDDFLKAGKPVIGMRTATHSFNGLKGEFEHYNWGYGGPKKEWSKGFGKLVLGETWVAHHGGHKVDACRGVIVGENKDHPILRGLKDGDVWGPSDTYTVNLPFPKEWTQLVLGEVTKRKSGGEKGDPFFGMTPQDVAVPGDKRNNPIMPVAWVKSYKLPDGKEGKAFTTTMGAATDLAAEGTRRMIVNAAYYLVGMEVLAEGTKVDTVGEFKPTKYGFGDHIKGLKPSDYGLK